ncbi:cytochrome c oxidase assembly protein COX18, mitochondrial isoform X2 [Halichoeres trimaculatus]|uniref:cytochrome c oxidase assembly protein COX18, mitochondrial isoform X2 n=1 Tax=Halichoeres trimaculatus TaxID=147232 RepID=UPI003D9E73BE
MMSVGGFRWTRVLKLSEPRLCCAPVYKKLPAPAHTFSASLSTGLPSRTYQTLPVRNLSAVWTSSGAKNLSGVWTVSEKKKLSGVWTPLGVQNLSGVWTVTGVRRFSGVAGDEGSAGFYGALSDSAPVHLCEHLLVSVQQVSGLPWWLSICMTTLSVRTLITLPLAAYQMVIIAKVEALQAEIAELAKRLRYEVSLRARERGWTEKQSRFQFKKNLRRLISQLYIRDNCHPFKASLLVWVQLPLWISLSLALRNLSLDQSALHSSLAAGGALWFPDLTAPDSTWILPVCLGLTNLLIVEVFSLQRVNPTRVQKIVTNFIRTFSVLMIPLAATVPSSTGDLVLVLRVQTDPLRI